MNRWFSIITEINIDYSPEITIVEAQIVETGSLLSVI